MSSLPGLNESLTVVFDYFLQCLTRPMVSTQPNDELMGLFVRGFANLVRDIRRMSLDETEVRRMVIVRRDGSITSKRRALARGIIRADA